MKKSIEKLRKRSKLLKSRNKCINLLSKSKIECNHDIVLLLGTYTEIFKTYVCPICGTCHFASKEDGLDNPFLDSNILDFRSNPIGTKMDKEKFVIEGAIRNAMEVAAFDNKNITIREFIESIPSDWYTTDSILKSKVKVKKITR